MSCTNACTSLDQGLLGCWFHAVSGSAGSARSSGVRLRGAALPLDKPLSFHFIFVVLNTCWLLAFGALRFLGWEQQSSFLRQMSSCGDLYFQIFLLSNPFPKQEALCRLIPYGGQLPASQLQSYQSQQQQLPNLCLSGQRARPACILQL